MPTVHKRGKKVVQIGDGNFKLTIATADPSGWGPPVLGAIQVSNIVMYFSVEEMRAIVEKFKDA